MKRGRLARACASVTVLGVATLGWLYLPAGAQAPSGIQVFSAVGSAASLGILSRVPAETDGGVAFSGTTLDLTKARATAAAETLGPLGEAFLQTTLTGYVNPTLAVAEYPATAAFQPDVTSTGSTTTPAGLPLSGQAGLFHAVATGQPSATATAAPATAELKGLISIGSGTSSSHSEVGADGSVITEVHASVSSIAIAGVLSIAGLTSSAKVVVPLNGTPRSSLKVDISGANVAGVPVDFTSDGVQIARQATVPASAIAMVNAALASLSAQGVTVTAVPIDKSGDVGTATVSGAALELHYLVPATTSLPTDIGKNEDIQLGQVSASALGRARRPLSLPPALSATGGLPGGTSAAQGTASGGLSTSPSGGAGALGNPLAGPGNPLAAPGTTSTPAVATGASSFRLPSRRRVLTAQQRLTTTYGIIILVAFAGATALVTRSRTRLTS